jgi:2-polyprenyl-3-methyl-5-hydroxy-6-metoxy-1,4-benzoquinol methylase
MLEHVTQQQGYLFLRECYRVLKPAGVLRVGVPDIKRIWEMCSVPQIFTDYAVERGGSPTIAVENVIFKFDHKSAYTADLLDTMLRAIGFWTVAANRWDRTPFAEFQPALDSHHKIRSSGLNECDRQRK